MSRGGLVRLCVLCVRIISTGSLCGFKHYRCNCAAHTIPLSLRTRQVDITMLKRDPNCIHQNGIVCPHALTFTILQRNSACSRVPIWCAKLSSCVMMMSWKFSWSLRASMMAFSASAREEALSAQKGRTRSECDVGMCFGARPITFLCFQYILSSDRRITQTVLSCKLACAWECIGQSFWVFSI